VPDFSSSKKKSGKTKKKNFQPSAAEAATEPHCGIITQPGRRGWIFFMRECSAPGREDKLGRETHFPAKALVRLVFHVKPARFSTSRVGKSKVGGKLLQWRKVLPLSQQEVNR